MHSVFLSGKIERLIRVEPGLSCEMGEAEFKRSKIKQQHGAIRAARKPAVMLDALVKQPLVFHLVSAPTELERVP